MQKKFITNLALLLFLNLLIKPFWILGIDRSVQNAVGAEVYGIYYSLLNFSFLLNIILDVGITNFNNRNIAQNNHLVTKHLSSIVVLRMVLAGLFIVATMLSGWLIGYSIEQMQILAVLGLNQALLSFIIYLRSNLSGLHLFRTDSFVSVLDRLIMISICAVLLWGGISDTAFKIEWFIYAQTSAYILTALITLMIVMDRARLKRLKWNYTFFIMILKQSYPFAVLVLLMTFYNRIDTVMLERMLPDGAEQSGIYASAYRLLDSANMVAFLFAGLLLPIFARMIKLKDSVEELVKLVCTLLIVPAIVAATVSYFFRTELMDLLYGDPDAFMHVHIEESAQIFGVLMACFVAISTTYIFGTLLTANGNLKELNIMAFTGMLLNIGMNLLLIPSYKAAGSAFSSLITQFSTAIVQIIIVQYIFRFRINLKFIFSLVMFAASVCLFCYYAKTLDTSWFVQISAAVAASVVLAFAIRLISVRSVFRILKYG